MQGTRMTEAEEAGAPAVQQLSGPDLADHSGGPNERIYRLILIYRSK